MSSIPVLPTKIKKPAQASTSPTGIGHWNGSGEFKYGTTNPSTPTAQTYSSSARTSNVTKPDVDPVSTTEKLLTKTKNKPWSFISAYHNSRDESANKQMHQSMRQEIQKRGYTPKDVTGYYTYQTEGGQKAVSQEPSYLVPGMGTKEAIELGHRYNQEAILSHEGMFNVGENTMFPVTNKRFIRGQIPKTEDQSVIRTPGGAKSTFLINTDWDNPREIKGYHPHLNKSYKLRKAIDPSTGTPKTEVQPVGNPRVHAMANDYVQKHGIADHLPAEQPYAPLNQGLGKRVADAYEHAPHNPSNPDVKQAYGAFAKEIKQQYDHAVKNGMTFEPWGKDSEPYKDSQDMRADVANNNHLGFYQGGDMPKDHPLAQIDPNHGLSYNDMFRAVHDLYGHSKGGYNFTARGEYNAFLAHKQMFSPLAQQAMRSETHGQNSFVNFGSHLRRPDGSLPKKGEPGWIHPANRPFAPQKAVILGDWTEGTPTNVAKSHRPLKKSAGLSRPVKYLIAAEIIYLNKKDKKKKKKDQQEDELQNLSG